LKATLLSAIMSDTTTASFYPNICQTYKVRVLDAEPVNASNDWGTANYEVRHFIDRDYLASIDQEEGIMESLISPTPPCHTVWGTKTEGGETVVGMLSRRLTITLLTDSIHGWQQVKLRNVLVIDRLPVPIHVSLKTLLKETNINLSYNSNNSSMLCVTSVPRSFRDHPYWNDDGRTVMMGSVGAEGVDRTNQLTTKITENATGRPNKLKMGEACANCGLSYCTMQCARCEKESYCSKECQKKRWRIHKTFCE